MPQIRDASEHDHAAILRLNKVEEVATSPMDGERLGELHALASHLWVVDIDGAPEAFLLVMRDGDVYENDNHAWFRERYDRFAYVDRIVVSEACKGRGVGRALYEHLFEVTREAGIPRVVCEYNIEPPNLPSKAFHDRFGFTEVGTRRTADGQKLLSMQALELGA